MSPPVHIIVRSQLHAMHQDRYDPYVSLPRDHSNFLRKSNRTNRIGRTNFIPPLLLPARTFNSNSNRVSSVVSRAYQVVTATTSHRPVKLDPPRKGVREHRFEAVAITKRMRHRYLPQNPRNGYCTAISVILANVAPIYMPLEILPSFRKSWKRNRLGEGCLVWPENVTGVHGSDHWRRGN